MRQLVVLLKTLFMAGCAIVIFGAITRQLCNLDRFIALALPSWMADAGILLDGGRRNPVQRLLRPLRTGWSVDAGVDFPDPGVVISRGRKTLHTKNLAH
jgi:hypothetical protein